MASGGGSAGIPLGVEIPLDLADDFDDAHGDRYMTLRYDFLPASVRNDGQGSLRVDAKTGAVRAQKRGEAGSWLGREVGPGGGRREGVEGSGEARGWGGRWDGEVGCRALRLAAGDAVATLWSASSRASCGVLRVARSFVSGRVSPRSHRRFLSPSPLPPFFPSTSFSLPPSQAHLELPTAPGGRPGPPARFGGTLEQSRDACDALALFDGSRLVIAPVSAGLKNLRPGAAGRVAEELAAGAGAGEGEGVEEEEEEDFGDDLEDALLAELSAESAAGAGGAEPDPWGAAGALGGAGEGGAGGGANGGAGGGAGGASHGVAGASAAHEASARGAGRPALPSGSRHAHAGSGPAAASRVSAPASAPSHLSDPSLSFDLEASMAEELEEALMADDPDGVPPSGSRTGEDPDPDAARAGRVGAGYGGGALAEARREAPPGGAGAYAPPAHAPAPVAAPNGIAPFDANGGTRGAPISAPAPAPAPAPAMAPPPTPAPPLAPAPPPAAAPPLAPAPAASLPPPADPAPEVRRAASARPPPQSLEGMNDLDREFFASMEDDDDEEEEEEDEDEEEEI